MPTFYEAIMRPESYDFDQWDEGETMSQHELEDVMSDIQDMFDGKLQKMHTPDGTWNLYYTTEMVVCAVHHPHKD